MTAVPDAAVLTEERPPLRSRALVWLALGCVVFAALFSVFATEVMERETGGLDTTVRAWMLAHRSPAGLALFGALTWLGAKEVLFAVALVVGWYVARRGARLRTMVVLGAPVAFGLLVAVLKRSFGVVRPPSEAAGLLGFAFPSGHTAGSTATAIVLVYVLARERATSRRALATGAAVALLVGVSRVYLDVHWASDVIGGWAIGAALGTAGCSLYEWARRAERVTGRAAPGDVTMS